MSTPSLRLNDGHAIPQIGLGTASLNDEQIAPVVVTAIEAGYRHIDTAFRYGNQRGVGKGIRAIQNVNALRWFRHHGVWARWSLLHGPPSSSERPLSAASRRGRSRAPQA